MRTQTLHDDVDERSWRLPQVDPTGWLVGSAGATAGPAVPGRAPGAEPEVGPDVPPGAVRRRRPRRTEAARAARERDLARRRRRRQGRALVVDRRAVTVVVGPGLMGRSGRPGSTIGRVADPDTRANRRAPDSGGRIGRWGRLTLTLLVVATLALLVGRVVAGSMAGAPDLVEITVRPGDTLWSIASSTSPDRDPRVVIDDIREINEISGDVVRVGEVLRVPVFPG